MRLIEKILPEYTGEENISNLLDMIINNADRIVERDRVLTSNLEDKKCQARP